MADQNIIIQQLRDSNIQLKKISELNKVTDIENDTNLVGSYLLLTKPNSSNFTVKLESILNKISNDSNDNINSKLEAKISNLLIELNNLINEKLDNYYTKEDINSGNIQNPNIDDLRSYVEQAIATWGPQLRGMEDELTDNENIIRRFQNSRLDRIESELQELRNTCISQLEDIVNELMNEGEDPDNDFKNSRIDKLTKRIQYIRDNVNIDTLGKLVWKNGTASDLQVNTVNNEEVIQITVNKGTITAYYNDESPDENVTTNAAVTLSTNCDVQDNGNTAIITLNNKTVGGNQSITMKYQNHTAVKDFNSTEIAKINVTLPMYYNYFFLVNSDKLSEVYDGTTFTANYRNYRINRSTGCPIVASTTSNAVSYNAQELILSKFYHNESVDLTNNALYMILPTEYVSIVSGPKLKINGKILKSNIFEIIIADNTETKFFVEETSDPNIISHTKKIQYSLIKISNNINSGIDLNL